MYRKILAAILIVAAVACGTVAVPGLVDNVAYACNARDCGD